MSIDWNKPIRCKATGERLAVAGRVSPVGGDQLLDGGAVVRSDCFTVFVFADGSCYSLKGQDIFSDGVENVPDGVVAKVGEEVLLDNGYRVWIAGVRNCDGKLLAWVVPMVKSMWGKDEICDIARLSKDGKEVTKIVC